MSKRSRRPSEAKPKYVAICNEIVDSIESGRLVPGEDLPSVRTYANERSISPATVDRAYSWLEANGYIETVPGKGSRVSFIRGETLPSTTGWQVFWSYAHKDDELAHGAITKLCQAIKDEYQLQTGDELRVFLDKDSLEWGDNWQEVINSNLGDTVFFIPVLTPTYLRRPSCIQELKTVFYTFREAGLDKGIYPIHFVNVDKVLGELHDDELANFLKTTQAELSDYPFKFRDDSSVEYQQCVYKIVSTLIKLNDSLVDAQNRIIQQNKERLSVDVVQSEEPGILELLASMEESSKGISDIVAKIQNTIEDIGAAVDGEEINANDSFSKKLAVFKRVASRLAAPANKINEQCTEYNLYVSGIGKGIDALVMYSGLIEGEEREEFAEGVSSLHTSMVDLNAQTAVAFVQVRSLIEEIKKVEVLSRELRPSCRTIRSALEDFCGSEMAFKRWEGHLAQIVKESTMSARE